MFSSPCQPLSSPSSKWSCEPNEPSYCCHCDKVNSDHAGDQGTVYISTIARYSGPIPPTPRHFSSPQSLSTNQNSYTDSPPPFPLITSPSPPLYLKSHRLLDLGNRQAGVEALGARPGAVENGVAAVQAHRVVEGVLALGRLLVAGVDQPAVRLEQDGGAEVLLRVPPVRGARGRAAGAQDALVEAVELLAVRLALPVLLALWLCQRGRSRRVSSRPAHCQPMFLLTSGAGVSRCRYGLIDLYCL